MESETICCDCVQSPAIWADVWREVVVAVKVERSWIARWVAPCSVVTNPVGTVFLSDGIKTRSRWGKNGCYWTNIGGSIYVVVDGIGLTSDYV